MKKEVILCCVALVSLIFNPLRAQSVEVEWIELQGDKVIVHYNLNDGNLNRQFLVNLFSSKDNFTVPLNRVTGDVGTDVRPGADRKITWDITKELGSFKGNLSFEVRGRIFVPFVKLTEFETGKVFKRGNNYPITWTSGNVGGQINIELINGRQERVQGDQNIPNSGRYDFDIPTSVKAGSDYRLRFTNAKDRNEVQYSNPFTIKPKLPLALKVAAVAVVGGGIFLLTGSKSDSPAVVPETAIDDFPGIPKP